MEAPLAKRQKVEERTCVEERNRAVAQLPENRRKALVKRVLEQKAKGIVYYEFGNGWQWNLLQNEGPFAALPSENVAGEYQVYYQAFKCDFCLVQRTTDRTLTLTVDDSGIHQCSVGKTPSDMNYGRNGHVCEFDDEFEFKEARKGETRIDCEMTEYPSACSEYDIDVQFSFLSERIACNWIPSEWYNPDDQDSVQDDLAQPPFENIQAAEAAVRSYRDSYSWTKKLIFPEYGTVGETISEYCSPRRPCPAMFFEPGDLCVAVSWGSDFCCCANSFYMARKKVG